MFSKPQTGKFIKGKSSIKVARICTGCKRELVTRKYCGTTVCTHCMTVVAK